MFDKPPMQAVFLFLILMVSMIFFRLLDRARWISSKWMLCLFLIPGLIIPFCVKYWDDCKSQVIYFFITIFISILIGSLSGYPFTTKILEAMSVIALWPLYAIPYIGEYFDWKQYLN